MAVHQTISVRISKNALNNAMYAAGLEYIDKVMVPDLYAAAQKGREAAEEGFANAIYDGNNDVRVAIDQPGPRTVELYAVGHSLPYIEYGTGVFNKNNYYKNQILGGKDYWFFSGRGEVNSLTAGGQKAHYRRGGWEHERYYYIGPKGGKHYVGPDYAVKKGNQVVLPHEGKNGADLQLQVEITSKPLEVIEKADSYITRGNPPNNVMRHAKHVMLREFNSHYKTEHSTYEP